MLSQSGLASLWSIKWPSYISLGKTKRVLGLLIQMVLNPGFLTRMLDNLPLVQRPLSSLFLEQEMASDRRDHTVPLKKKANDRSVISVLWISLIVKVGVWTQRPVQAARCQPACLNFSPSEPRNSLIILCNMWPSDSGKQKQRESCYATRQAAAEPRSPRTGNFYKHEWSWKTQMDRIL